MRQRLISSALLACAVCAALMTAPRDACAENAVVASDELADFNPLPPLVPREPPKTSFSELGVSAGFTGSSGGIGPAVVFRGGLRQDFGRFILSVNVLLSLETRSSDEDGSLPPNLTGGASVTSFSVVQRAYVVGLPIEGRFRLGRSPFSAGLALMPFIAFENANVSFFGGDVGLPSPQTLVGGAALGVLHLDAGPGSIELDAGVRASTVKSRQVQDADLLGPYVTLGYRLAL
jgi:hypothetical protein